MSHGDYGAYEKKLIMKYKTTNVSGVASLLRDIHSLREQRFQGADTTMLSSFLLDFEKITELANLTGRQKEALYFHYEKDLTQNETSQLMGISQQAVSKHIDNAIAKIVIVAKEEENANERTT